MIIEESKFLVDLDVVEEKVKDLRKISLSLIEFFQKKELDLLVSEVSKRQGIITGFLEACKMISSKITKVDESFVEKPLSYLKNNSEGSFKQRVSLILDEWEYILVLEDKIQSYSKLLPKIMKENLVHLQKAKPALKAYGVVADVKAKTDPRFERKK